MEEGFFVKVFRCDDLQNRSQDHWGLTQDFVRLPHDRVGTAGLNGPCRTYRLSRPMELWELEAMPRDLQLAYLRRLRALGGTRETVGAMLGVPPARVDRWGVRFDRPDPTAWAAVLHTC